MAVEKIPGERTVTFQGSCDIVALRENFIDRPESYDSFSAKSCVFLAHGLGVYFSIPLHNLAQSKVSKILKTFTYYYH
jgi:hypothetical protein